MADLLVVDDDVDVRTVLEVLLSRLGHDVRLADSAEEALLLSAARRADLMILDLSLPGLDGDEFLRWLDRGIGRPKALCIISGRSEEEIQPIAARYGATYLSKPFQPHELEHAITTALATTDGDVTLLP